MITYTNLAFPKNKNNIPINAFDPKLWKEKYPTGVCYKQQKEDMLVWRLGCNTTPVDASKLQWVLTIIKSLEIHGTGGKSIPDSIQTFLQEATAILPPHSKAAIQKFVDRHIPHVRTVDTLDIPRSDDGGVIFFVDNPIFRPHKVIDPSQ